MISRKEKDSSCSSSPSSANGGGGGGGGGGMKMKMKMKYKGVRKRAWGKWVSEIRLPNSRERIWLGSYDSPDKAARAFDAATFCLRGGKARFNFPDHIPADVNPSGRSLTPSEIQEAAYRFANETTALGKVLLPSSSCVGGIDAMITDGSDGDQDLLLRTNSTELTDLLLEDETVSAVNGGDWPGFDESCCFDSLGRDLYDEYFAPPQLPPSDDSSFDIEDELHYGSQHSFLWDF